MSEEKKPRKKAVAAEVPPIESTRKVQAPIEYRNPTLMLVDSVFINDGNQPVANFVAIPVNNDAPYLEVIFDPETKVLAAISKYRKTQFHFVERVDQDGIPIKNKNKVYSQVQPFQKQRVEMEVYHEYYIRSFEEIEAFLMIHAINPDYDFQRFFK